MSLANEAVQLVVGSTSTAFVSALGKSGSSMLSPSCHCQNRGVKIKATPSERAVVPVT